MDGILVIKPSSLGDIVHTLPAVHAVRQAFPGEPLRWLVNTEWEPVLQGNPDLTEVIAFPRSTFRGIGGLLRGSSWIGELRGRLRPRLVLDFQGLFRSAWMGKRLRPERLLGLDDAREGAVLFYDGVARTRPAMHSVERYLALAELAGAKSGRDARFPLPDGNAPAGFEPEERFVVLHPYARGEGKALGPAGVSDLVAALAPIRVVIVGRGERLDLPLENVVDLTGRTTLPELIWLLRRSAYNVSVDSGPMHLAAAVNPRLIAIHTWSDPGSVGPYSKTALVWKGGELRPGQGRDYPTGTQAPDGEALCQIASKVKEAVGAL